MLGRHFQSLTYHGSLPVQILLLLNISYQSLRV